MIEQLESPAQASAWAAHQRARGRSLGFVPTMGALHEGHLSLVERALAENDLACVSVFVNPLQFDEASDLDAYPRDWQGDVQRLQDIGCQMVFTGTLAQFFEGQLDAAGKLAREHHQDPGAGALGLEGACRDGHFEGVATIVDRLFDVLHPDRAYFGQKDYQQTLVVREVARRRRSPQIVVCPISREPSGLARSSRNQRLSSEEREHAACLSRALRRCAASWHAGERDAAQLERVLRAEFDGEPVGLEYAAVRGSAAWTVERPAAALESAVAVVAARVGPVRLLDNHLLDEPFPGFEA